MAKYNVEMEYGWLNIGSLLLGLTAWILPLVFIFASQLRANRWVPIVSLAACSVALVLQIAYQNHLVRIEDWTGLEDTSGPLLNVSSVLVLVTLVLNVIISQSRYSQRKFIPLNGQLTEWSHEGAGDIQQ